MPSAVRPTSKQAATDLEAEPGRGFFMGGAFCFLFNSNDEILVLEERPDKRKYTWDLPGGTLDEDEDPVAGLRREVREETGLEIELVSPLCYLKWDRHESGWPILVAFYVAKAVGDDVALSREHASCRWVSADDIEREQLALAPGLDATRDLFALWRSNRTA